MFCTYGHGELRNACISNVFVPKGCSLGNTHLGFVFKGFLLSGCPDPHFAQCIYSFSACSKCHSFGIPGNFGNDPRLNVFTSFSRFGAKAMKAVWPATRPAGASRP